ncbi:hypothetical protein COL60_12135 [Bacillus pseudomycoides]|uniref:O-antigen polymerase n=1 Tax=Bacillus pseudomycoides TaxID=64104 RepID=UPI000BEBA518|nr:O-antigen polymerase [Bacillus pseudomycoides]PEA84137.1 hypothetical protein CON99_08030 [Bacillus pseudomycoides]PFZ10030.1 hypothetical protein COL60_12135 [Bacillus pseudomycoides]PFZ11283.1 hypothetical protein COL63_17560 [Bacillus pseudomycoides]
MGIILILLFFVCLIKRNYVFVLGIYMISILGIPKNSYIENILGLELNKRIPFDFRFLLIILMLTFLVFKANKGLIKVNIKYLLVSIPIICIFVVSLINGINNSNPLIKSELGLYGQIFLVVFTIIWWVNKFKITTLNLLNICIIGGVIYSIIAVFFAIFGKEFLPTVYGGFYGEIWGKTGRVTFQNVTTLFLISLFSLYLILEKASKRIYIPIFLLNNAAILLSQTRSIILQFYACLLIIGMIVVVKILKRKHLNLKVLAYSLIGIPCVIIGTLIILQYSNLNENSIIENVVNRFTESGTGSIDSRVYTNQTIIENVDNLILGNGIGYPLKFLNASGQLVNEGSWIDNLFLSLYSKLGLLGVFVLTLLIIYGMILNIKAYLSTKDIYFLIISVVYIPFIIICTFLTSQLIHSIQVSIIYLMVLLIPKMALQQRRV